MSTNPVWVDPPDPDPRRPASLLPPDVLAASAARPAEQLAGLNPKPAPLEWADNPYRRNRYDFVLLVVVNMISFFYATSRTDSSPRDAILTILVLNALSWIVIHGNVGPLLKRVLTALAR